MIKVGSVTGRQTTSSNGRCQISDDSSLIEHSAIGYDDFQVHFHLTGLPVAGSFVDQDIEMEQIEHSLLPSGPQGGRKIHVLHGLGSIGKTQLAIAYARKHQEVYSAIRTLGSPAVSGAYKDGPAPSLRLPICLRLYLTYFPLFIAILKDSHPPFSTQTTFLTAIRYGSSQSIAARSTATRELLSRLPLHEKPALSSRVLQRTIREGR